MLLFENLSQLANDCITELLELMDFQHTTALGYSLIEENYKSNIKVLEECENLRQELFPNEILSSLDRIRSAIAKEKFPNIDERKSNYINTINKSIIIYACSIFDDFLNRSIKFLLLKHPQKLNSEKKAIPFYEFLLKEKDVIIESIIDREIYELSYKRIDERIQELSKTFELDLEYTEGETTFFQIK